MTPSEDNEFRIAMRRCIEDEHYFRKITSDRAAIFLDCKDDGVTRTGMSIITVSERRVCRALSVRVKLEEPLLMIKVNASEKKTDALGGIRRYLTKKIIRPQKFEKLMSKEKHGTTCATLQNNRMSNKMLTDAKITR
jgi:hypothetical protein